MSPEEQGEDTEGSAKSTSVAVGDDKDSSERDNSESKKASKDSGKMLEFCLPFFLTYEMLFYFKLSGHSHYYSLHVRFACDFYQ